VPGSSHEELLRGLREREPTGCVGERRLHGSGTNCCSGSMTIVPMSPSRLAYFTVQQNLLPRLKSPSIWRRSGTSSGTCPAGARLAICSSGSTSFWTRRESRWHARRTAPALLRSDETISRVDSQTFVGSVRGICATTSSSSRSLPGRKTALGVSRRDQLPGVTLGPGGDFAHRCARHDDADPGDGRELGVATARIRRRACAAARATSRSCAPPARRHPMNPIAATWPWPPTTSAWRIWRTRGCSRSAAAATRTSGKT
jgi:hypothetical protein